MCACSPLVSLVFVFDVLFVFVGGVVACPLPFYSVVLFLITHLCLCGCGLCFPYRCMCAFSPQYALMCVCDFCGVRVVLV